ncbi:MAG: CvpA family protein [Owenweeksia sp.]|nr:CvpA family protein [Owenweeksia sp.]
MNYVDILLLLPLAYGLVRGLFKGLVRELASLAAIFLGLLGAYLFSHDLAEWLSQQFEIDGGWVHIMAYVIIFLIVALVLQIIARLLTQMLQALALGLLNRLLGGIFGLAKIGLVLLLMVFLLDPYLSDLHKKNTAWNQSVVYKQLREYSHLPGKLLTGFKEQKPDDWAIPTPE